MNRDVTTVPPGTGTSLLDKQTVRKNQYHKAKHNVCSNPLALFLPTTRQPQRDSTFAPLFQKVSILTHRERDRETDTDYTGTDTGTFTIRQRHQITAGYVRMARHNHRDDDGFVSRNRSSMDTTSRSVPVHRPFSLCTATKHGRSPQQLCNPENIHWIPKTNGTDSSLRSSYSLRVAIGVQSSKSS